MLAAVLPTTAAFELWRWPPKIHLFIFVHRVEGLAPGLYALPRDHGALEQLQAATLADFDWQKVSEAIPLYHLYSGECRQIAKTVSCHQPIASDSAFSLGMVAEFSETIETSTVALPPLVLGMRFDRSGALSGSRSGRHSRHRDRLLL